MAWADRHAALLARLSEALNPAGGTEGQIRVASGVDGADEYVTPNAVYSWSFPFANRLAVDGGSGTINMVDADRAGSTTVYNEVSLGYGLADTFKRGAVFQFVVPAELDVAQPVTAKAYCRLLSAPSATHKVEIEWTGRIAADNESDITGGALFSGAVIKVVDAHSGGDRIVIDLGTMFAGGVLAADDFVHGVIFRDATAGNVADDTYTSTVHIMDIQWTGSRKLVV